MPNLLRQLRKRNKWHWNQPLSWLDEGDVPADPLANLETTKNTLSVFEVDDDISKIERIAAAMAGQSTNGPEEFDYIIFDQSILSEVGIKILKSNGQTPDNEVNSWHYDLTEISVTKLASLAKHIVPSTKSRQILSKRVKEVFIENARMGKIQWDKVTIKKSEMDKLREEIEQKRSGNK